MTECRTNTMCGQYNLHAYTTTCLQNINKFQSSLMFGMK